MAEVIEMPKLSDTMEEGGVANWLKKEGEFVEDGEALLEIETDKATMEYNSPEEGVLLKIIVAAGETTSLNAPIAVIGEKGETFDLKDLLEKYNSSQSPESREKPEPTVDSSAPESTPGTPTLAPSVAIQPEKRGRIRSSPLARKVAKERGIDILALAGSGPGGRIILADVEKNEARAPAPASQVAIQSAGSKVIPLTMMRKTIAKRLLAAKNEAPHFYLTVSADMTNLMQWRKVLNKDLQEGQPKTSVNDLLVTAIAKALKKHPEVNASWTGDSITQHADVHVAVAVAVQDGLITPVIRNTDLKGVRTIAAEAKVLVKKARDGQLKPDEYVGGTFTISNLGMMGIEEFTAIINPPQSAILAVGATIPTPWVSDDGEVIVQPRMKMTMSCDHRVIDGALGALFLQTLVSYLQEPTMMLA